MPSLQTESTDNEGREDSRDEGSVVVLQDKDRLHLRDGQQNYQGGEASHGTREGTSEDGISSNPHVDEGQSDVSAGQPAFMSDQDRLSSGSKQTAAATQASTRALRSGGKANPSSASSTPVKLAGPQANAQDGFNTPLQKYSETERSSITKNDEQGDKFEGQRKPSLKARQQTKMRKAATMPLGEIGTEVAMAGDQSDLETASDEISDASAASSTPSKHTGQQAHERDTVEAPSGGTGTKDVRVGAPSGSGTASGEILDASTASSTPSRRTGQQAHERDTVEAPSRGTGIKDVRAGDPSGSGAASNTDRMGPTPPVPENQDHRQLQANPSDSGPASNTNRMVPGPLAPANRVRPQLMNMCRQLKTLGCYMIVTVTLLLLIFAVYSGLGHTTCSVSTPDIVTGFSQTHTNLSQAVARSNTLYQEPKNLMVKRQKARSFRSQLPKGSLTIQPLNDFLEQSVNVDADLNSFMLSFTAVAESALREHQFTIEEIRFIQGSTFTKGVERLRIFVTGLSVGESRLQTRLKTHLRRLDRQLTRAEKFAHDVLQGYTNLTYTTNSICENSIWDRERYLAAKDRAVLDEHWLRRLGIQMLSINESNELAFLTRNVQNAESIHTWAKDLVEILESAISHLRSVKLSIAFLQQIMDTGGTVTWHLVGQDRELEGFLAEISNGAEILEDNTLTFRQLRRAGHLSQSH